MQSKVIKDTDLKSKVRVDLRACLEDEMAREDLLVRVRKVVPICDQECVESFPTLVAAGIWDHCSLARAITRTSERGGNGFCGCVTDGQCKQC